MFDILQETQPLFGLRCRRHASPRRARQAKRHPGLFFEPLGPRLLLSASFYDRVDFALQDSGPTVSGEYPGGVIAVDLNDDGLLDLVIPHVGPLDMQSPFQDTIGILFGQSDGSFGDYRQFDDAGVEPLDVVADDVNEDGILDLVVTNGSSESTITILIGALDQNDLWEVASSTSLQVGRVGYDDIVGIVSGDFNQDGHRDILVANAGLEGNSNQVSWFLGNGDGTFQSRVDWVLEEYSSPQYLAIADFNGDGWDDVAVSQLGEESGDGNSVSVLFSVVDGSDNWLGFEGDPADDIPVGVDPIGIVAFDFNGDGIVDIAVANNGNPGNSDHGSISVILAEDDGFGGFDGFSTPVDYDIHQLAGLSGPTQLRVEDMNLDGNVDLVFTARNSDKVGILFGDGDGTFGQVIAMAVGDQPRFGLAVGDFNGDQVPDIAATNWDDDNVSVLYFVGLTVSGGRTELTHGDFNGDGDPDLAAVTSTGIRVLLNKGGADFDDTDTDYYVDLALPSGVSAANITDIIAADVIGSSDVDIIITDAGNHKVWIFESNGSTGLDFEDGNNAQGFDVGYSPRAVIAANFHDDHGGTLDGKLDLATVNWFSETVTILWAQSGGGYDDTITPGKRQDYVVQDTIFGSVTDFTADDFNDDGYLDLAVVADGFAEVYVMKNLSGSAFAARGNGDFRTYDISGPGTAIATGDFNNDGDPDLVVTVATSFEGGIDDNVVNVLFGQGPWFDDTLAAGKRQVVAVGPNPVAVTIGRFNNDGIDDFAVLNQAGGSVQGSVTIYFGVQSGNPANPMTILNIGSLPWSITAADFDDDDDEDELALTIYNGQMIRILLVS